MLQKCRQCKQDFLPPLVNSSWNAIIFSLEVFLLLLLWGVSPGTKATEGTFGQWQSFIDKSHIACHPPKQRRVGCKSRYRFAVPNPDWPSLPERSVATTQLSRYFKVWFWTEQPRLCFRLLELCWFEGQLPFYVVTPASPVSQKQTPSRLFCFQDI